MSQNVESEAAIVSLVWWIGEHSTGREDSERAGLLLRRAILEMGGDPWGPIQRERAALRHCATGEKPTDIHG